MPTLRIEAKLESRRPLVDIPPWTLSTPPMGVGEK
jgi:hypothetical protein